MRAASTTVLARSGNEGPELLFVRRPEHMRFLGGFHAFPGGALDESDFSDEAAALSAMSPEAASNYLGEAAGDFPAFGFYICAIRELFEEVGILFAYDHDRLAVLSHTELDSARSRLIDDRESFATVLKSLGLRAATDLLRYHSRWTAPEALPVRFDVRVFVGPALSKPNPDPREVERVDWMTPAHAMASAEVGTVWLAPPTVATITSLSSFLDADALISGIKEDKPSAPAQAHSPLVRRIVAPNSSVMTGPGTNTYLVGRHELVVIDPGSMETSHLSAIASAGKVRIVVVTHYHPDHISGALELTELTGARFAASERFFQRAPFSRGLALADDATIELEDFSMTAMFTPGHASDHICLWLEQEKALFSGDLVLGEGTTVISPPDGNLRDYLASLDKVAALRPVKLYPGHFDPRDDAAQWIAWYIEHRLEREGQIIEALKSGLGSPEQIVGAVYSSYPSALFPVAERSVLAHLDKLVADGLVVERAGTFELVSPP